MLAYTANQAKTRFGEFLDHVQREPVQVLKRDRVVAVMVSAHDFEAMRRFYADRLQTTLAASALQAAQSGLAEAQVDQLLADES